MLYLQHVFNVNSGIRAIIKNANNHVGKLRRDPFGLFALRGTTGVRIFRIVRAASAMRASVLFATNAASVAGEIKKRFPVAVFLQRFGYLRMNER